MYVPSSRKIISSYDVVFDESFSSALAYTSQPYSEATKTRPAATYTPCAMSSREQTGEIITFTQLEEGNILTKTHNDLESNYYDSIISLLLNEEDIDAMDFGDESYHDLISMYMLEDIRDRSQSHLNFNQRESRYKIRDRIRQRQLERKGALKYTRNMGKGLHKVFKTVVKDIFQ